MEHLLVTEASRGSGMCSFRAQRKVVWESSCHPATALGGQRKRQHGSFRLTQSGRSKKRASPLAESLREG